MYRERKDRLRENHRVRSSDTPKTLHGSLRRLCPRSHSYQVRITSSICSSSHTSTSFLHRELAFQISEQFAVLGAHLNIRTAVIVGGMDMMAQALELGRRPHVVIATPGRLVDHLRSSSGEWDLSRVRFLVREDLLHVRYLLVAP